MTTPGEPPDDHTGDDPDGAENPAEPDGTTAGDPDEFSGVPVVLPDELGVLPPGAMLAELLDELPVEQVSGYDTVAVMLAAYRQLAHQQAVFFEALAETGLRAPGSVTTVRRRREPSEFSCEEARAALVWSRTRAVTGYGQAYDLCVRLPALGKAMKRGELDLPRAKAFVGLDRRAHRRPSRARVPAPAAQGGRAHGGRAGR